MSSPKITIIDTGCANLASVKFALDRLKVSCTVSADETVINSSDKLILPGVGTAFAAMENLRARNLPEIITSCKKPIIGICLGMQMLGQSSTETANTDAKSIAGLGVVKGDIKLMQVGDLPLPHMGWNQVLHNEQCPLFKDIPSGSYFYFVHSYAMDITADTVATCSYGQEFTAVVNNANYFGTQFHPEKSGKIGAKLLQNFIDM